MKNQSFFEENVQRECECLDLKERPDERNIEDLFAKIEKQMNILKEEAQKDHIYGGEEPQKKSFTEIEEQIDILKTRELVIEDDSDTRKKLFHNNYYTIINGYKYPFLVSEKGSIEKYSAGTSFDEIFALYSFDCNLRGLLLKYILKIEHQLKSVISHRFACGHKHQSFPLYLLSKENFDVDKNGNMSPKKQKTYELLCYDLGEELEKQFMKHNEMLMHYAKKYGDIPPWILVSIFSFGMLRRFYSCLNNKDQNDIARAFCLKPEVLNSYLGALNNFRNSCAHDERIYNKKLKNKVIRKDVTGTSKEYNNVYVIILILKDMLDASSFMSFYLSLDEYITELEKKLKSIEIDKVFNEMGMPIDKTVRKTELGPLIKGNALSDTEFKDVLQRYIVPILPMNVKLEQVDENDLNRENRACKIIEYKNNKLYFTQASNSVFLYYVSLCGVSLSQKQVDSIEEHLSTLIDYIHIFWNLSNLSAYGREKVAVAFPTLCEQAYELAICNLMCRKDSKEAMLEYKDDYKNYKQQIGEKNERERRELTATIKKKQMEINKIIEREGIVEKTLYGVLSQIESWSIKTYEGQKKTFGIVICMDEMPNDELTFNYVEFLKTDFSATINDGVYSAVELYADGSFKEHFTIDTNNNFQFPSIPYPFSGFANRCQKEKIGILLTETGDILIVNDKKLCYTKHNGNWLCSMSDKVIDQIAKEIELDSQEQAEIIYQAVVDVSYSRGGACIGIINENTLPKELKEMIGAGLFSVEKPSNKVLALKTMISFREHEKTRQKSFFELDRTLRRELLELDGAMVLSNKGEIYVIGTIIKLNGSGSDGGGRTAAAKQLSKYGLAIKVSQDGYVQIFKQGETILEILT